MRNVTESGGTGMIIKTRRSEAELELEELGKALKERRVPLERYLNKAYWIVIKIMRGE